MTITERLNHRISLCQLDQVMGGNGSALLRSLSTYLSDLSECGMKGMAVELGNSGRER